MVTLELKMSSVFLSVYLDYFLLTFLLALANILFQDQNTAHCYSV